MKGVHTLSAELDFDTGEWEIDGEDYEQEFRNAVETVREDHDEECIIQADNLYHLRVRWNEPTEEVRFGVYAISETFRVEGE